MVKTLCVETAHSNKNLILHFTILQQKKGKIADLARSQRSKKKLMGVLDKRIE